jgi:tRNA(Ile)-lysidine synthase
VTEGPGDEGPGGGGPGSGGAAGGLVEPLSARCHFPERLHVTCAVSGGADSLALLVLARATGREVTAVHVDHGLRVGSAAEADVVRAAAERFGASFEARRVDVAPGPNLEERARWARYEVLPPDVLTGHTADDQAETVVLQLLRGGGLDALAGIRPERRPLLGLRRSETSALCSSLGLTAVVDPTNADRRFRRNRVRAEVIPLLSEVAERDVVPLLARAAGLARAEATLLDALAAAIDPTDAAALAAADPALARRVVRHWIGGDHPPDAATVERVLAVARGTARATELAGHRRVARTAGRLRIEPSPVPDSDRR